MPTPPKDLTDPATCYVRPMSTGCRASARLVWPALHRLRVMGREPDEVVRSVGLTPQEVADPDFRMPEELLDALWVAACEASGDEAFGIFAGLAPEPGQLGIVEYVVRNCPTIGDAMRAGARFQGILHDAGADAIEVHEDRVDVVVALSSGRESAGVLVDYGFARAIAAAMLLSGVPGVPLEVRFVHARPKKVDAWVDTFRCPLRFGADRNVMSVRLERLAALIPASDPGLLPILEQHALETLKDAPKENVFTHRVCELIAGELTGGTPTTERIAGKLKMSARTLSRRLGDEDTSFQVLLDELRRGLALSYLRDRDLCVSEVAFLLGFGDANAFSRAFKRWTGEPPSRYRALSP